MFEGFALKNTMEYKGYTGSVKYSDEDGIFFGKVQFIRALISYEGSNAEELRKDFHDGLDDYLAMYKGKKHRAGTAIQGLIQRAGWP